MPLPKPKKNESKDDFVARCLEDPATKEMQGTQAQKEAACFTQWDNREARMPTKTIDQCRDQLKKLAWPREFRERGKVQLRAGAGAGRSIEMFVPYGSDSVDMGFTEVIEPGAFTRSIRNGIGSQRADIFALWSHDSSQPLARQANKTLEFDDGADGLTAVATLEPAIDYHQRALQTVQAGLVRGTSFGFETREDDWAYDDEGNATRTLIEVKLFEVSPVVFPAYEGSDAEARSVLAKVSAASGLEATELLAILQDVKDGHAPAERRGALEGWIARLTGLLPVTPSTVTDDYYEQKLRTRQRLLQTT